jgi:hypothetical protein
MSIRTDVKEFLRGVDFLAIAERDFPFMVGTYNGRFTREGPCPICGGRTKLRLRLDDQTGIQKLYCEGQCNLHGQDAIGYLMWRDHVDFATARAELANAITVTPPPDWTPTPSAERAPNFTWQTKARDFVEACAEYLWTPGGAAALAYLRKRYLSDETLRAWKIGYNPKHREARGLAWGLAEQVVVSAAIGITIPRLILGELWAVNVRRMNPGGTPYAGPDKYICVTGSKLGLLGADDLKGAQSCFVFGGDFDAILAKQYAGPQVACVTFGGEGRAVNQPWINMLSHIEPLYICLDNDGAGDQGAAKWVVLPEARRVRVPLPYKDLTEYAQTGGDVAGWIAGRLDEAGLKRL